jgi:hypothetical protein
VEEKENLRKESGFEVIVGLGDLLEFKVSVSSSSINVQSFGDDFRKSTDMNIDWKSDDYTHICYNNNRYGTSCACRGRRNRQNTKDFETKIIEGIPKTEYFINLQKKLQK